MAKRMRKARRLKGPYALLVQNYHTFEDKLLKDHHQWQQSVKPHARNLAKWRSSLEDESPGRLPTNVASGDVYMYRTTFERGGRTSLITSFFLVAENHTQQNSQALLIRTPLWLIMQTLTRSPIPLKTPSLRTPYIVPIRSGGESIFVEVWREPTVRNLYLLRYTTERKLTND